MMVAAMTSEDAARLLGISPRAEQGTVNEAFRRLATTHHPDVGGDSEQFHRLVLARDTLLHQRSSAGRGIGSSSHIGRVRVFRRRRARPWRFHRPPHRP